MRACVRVHIYMCVCRRHVKKEEGEGRKVMRRLGWINLMLCCRDLLVRITHHLLKKQSKYYYITTL